MVQLNIEAKALVKNIFDERSTANEFRSQDEAAKDLKSRVVKAEVPRCSMGFPWLCLTCMGDYRMGTGESYGEEERDRF